ncbi:unnamed protein product [Lathyrus oleraceus]
MSAFGLAFMACTYDQKLWDCVSLAALFVLFWCMDSVVLFGSGVFGNSLLPCVCSCVVQLMCRIEFCRRFQMVCFSFVWLR